MSEIDCFGTPLSIGEVVPGWHLVQLLGTKPENPDYIVNGFVMGEGDYGLTRENDPDFCFSLPPLPDEPDDSTEESWSIYLKMLEHYNQRLVSTVRIGYELVNSSVQAGFEPKEGGFTSWLADRMYKTIEDYKKAFRG